MDCMIWTEVGQSAVTCRLILPRFSDHNVRAAVRRTDLQGQDDRSVSVDFYAIDTKTELM